MSKTIEVPDAVAEQFERFAAERGLTRDGAFAELLAEAMRADQDDSDLAPISDADIESVRAGVADNLAGRHSSFEDAVARVRAKYPRPATDSVPTDSAA